MLPLRKITKTLAFKFKFYHPKKYLWNLVFSRKEPSLRKWFTESEVCTTESIRKASSHDRSFHLDTQFILTKEAMCASICFINLGRLNISLANRLYHRSRRAYFPDITTAHDCQGNQILFFILARAVPLDY